MMVSSALFGGVLLPATAHAAPSSANAQHASSLSLDSSAAAQIRRASTIGAPGEAAALPAGCNASMLPPGTSNTNGNGLGDERFYTYDTQTLDDHATLRVNVAKGNLLVHLEPLHIRGTGLDLVIDLFYNSRADSTTEVGARWAMDSGDDVKLSVDSTTGDVTYYAPDHYTAVFNPLPSGGYGDVPGLDATLVKNGDGTWALNFHKTGDCFAFDTNGHLTAASDKNGNQITYSNASSYPHLTTSITDTQGRVTTFTYNSNNLLTTITDPIGRTIQFTYTTGFCSPACSYPTYLQSVTDPAGELITFAYDPNTGDLTSITDPNQHTTAVAYTTYDRPSTLTDPTNATTTFSYSVSGTSCPSGTTANQVTDAKGHTTTYCWQPATYLVQDVIDAHSHQRQTSYSPDYNVATLTDPLTNLTTFNWSADGKNNLQSVVDASGATTSFAYGDSGHPYAPTNTTDAQGTVLAYTYDSPGNLASVKDNTNNQNLLLDSYTYNANGTIATATNGDDKMTSFSYDANGNLTKVTPPSGGVLGDTTLSYDGVSRVTSVTDGRGLLTQFSYDKDDRITTITYNDSSTVSYTYDANGNVLSEADRNGTTSFTYDHDNRELTKSQPNSFSFTYTYDPVGNLSTLTDPGGKVTYAYNAVNDLTTLTEPDGITQVTFAYDQDDRRTTTTYPNGVTQTIGYDTAGRELSVIGTHGSTTLTSFTYCYVNQDPCPTTGTSNPSTNLRAWVKDGVSGNKTTYTYDTQNRLTAAKTINGSTTVVDYQYSYDAASNLTHQVDTANGSTDTTSYTLDPDNAVTSETVNGIGQTFSYDGDGNLTSWSGGWNLSYNAKNQTTGITDGGLSQSYTYSGADQQELLNFSSNGDTTQVANSALGETYQADSGGGLRFERDNRGALVSKTPDGTNYYFYLFDGEGSVVAVTDPSGNVANSYSYDPYGNVVSSSLTVSNPFEYASGWTSEVTDFTHFGARWYAPATQFTRWTQQDPIAGSLFQPTSQCRYAYADNNPVNLTDASGKANPFLLSGATQLVAAALCGAGVIFGVGASLTIVGSVTLLTVLQLCAAVFGISGALLTLIGIAQSG